MIEALSETLGAGDCERLIDASLIQPVNAWSSLAYSVVGVILVASVAMARPRERTDQIVFGLLLVATGIGSFLYHGPQSPGAVFLHDITFLSALWFLVLIDAGAALRWRPGAIWIAFGGVVAAITVILIAAPASTNVLTGLTVAGLIVSDLLLHRRGAIDGRWYGAALALFAGALFANVLGRSGAPTCSPDSVIQFHGLWHILSAAALGAYFIATAGPRSREPGA